MLGIRNVHEYVARIHSSESSKAVERLVTNVYLALYGRTPPAYAHWYMVHRLNAYTIMKRTVGLTTRAMQSKYTRALTFNPESVEDPTERLVVRLLLNERTKASEKQTYDMLCEFKIGRMCGFHAVKQFNQIYL